MERLDAAVQEARKEIRLPLLNPAAATITKRCTHRVLTPQSDSFDSNAARTTQFTFAIVRVSVLGGSVFSFGMQRSCGTPSHEHVRNGCCSRPPHGPCVTPAMPSISSTGQQPAGAALQQAEPDAGGISLAFGERPRAAVKDTRAGCCALLP